MAAVVVACLPADTLAQSGIPADARVVYVSAQRLSLESAVGKAGTTRIQAMQAERGAQLRARQQALETTRQQLAAATTPEERTRLALQETTQRTDTERATAQMQQDLQNLQREISNELRQKLVAVLTELLKGTKVEMVANLETAVVWAAPGLDITSVVLEKMNATTPKP
jgi:Skp family chaperone for outer membrane proteins